MNPKQNSNFIREELHMLDGGGFPLFVCANPHLFDHFGYFTIFFVIVGLFFYFAVSFANV